MTDTTDKLSLQQLKDVRELCLPHTAWRLIIDELISARDQIEAERQRAERYHFVAMSALEAQAEISEQLGISEDECDGSPEQIHEKIEMLQTKIAEMKGNQLPIAYLTRHMGCRSPDDCEEYLEVSDKDGVSGNGEPAIPVFTAPQKPVVPVGFLFVVKATGAVIYSIADAAIDGTQLIGQIYGDTAIEAAFGIVKDGE